jgi:hypothetical protein
MELTSIARLILDLDDLLGALVLQVQPVSSAGRTLRLSIDTACGQMQILRMLISMDHSVPEQLAAARDLAATLKLGDAVASRSRIAGEQRQAIQLAAAVAGRISRGLDVTV